MTRRRIQPPPDWAVDALFEYPLPGCYQRLVEAGPSGGFCEETTPGPTQGEHATTRQQGAIGRVHEL